MLIYLNEEKLRELQKSRNTVMRQISDSEIFKLLTSNKKEVIKKEIQIFLDQLSAINLKIDKVIFPEVGERAERILDSFFH